MALLAQPPLAQKQLCRFARPNAPDQELLTARLQVCATGKMPKRKRWKSSQTSPASITSRAGAVGLNARM